MRCLNDRMRRLFCSGRAFCLAAVLLAVGPLAWGETKVTALEKREPPAMSALPSKSEPTEERNLFNVNEEPREMPGIVFGSVIVNLILVTVFFALLRNEWKKHGKSRKPGADGKRGEP